MRDRILLAVLVVGGCLMGLDGRADEERDNARPRDAVATLAGAVESLVREVARLNERLQSLHEENDRLRSENERLRESARSSATPPAGAAPLSTRFRDRGEFVEDTQTGLLWQKDGDASGKLNFYQAQDFAAKLELENLSGWRVPTRKELAAIFPALEPPFQDTRYTGQPCCQGPGEWNSYWTSELDPRLPDYAYVYQWYADGGANNCIASRNHVLVRCVHDRLP